MKRPIPGQTYRLLETSTGGWRVHSYDEEDSFGSGDVKVRSGEILTCLNLCETSFRRARKDVDVQCGIWMLTNGRIVFDRPVPANINGHEDNIMNALIEL